MSVNTLGDIKKGIKREGFGVDKRHKVHPMKRTFLISLLIFLTVLLGAGDIAVLENLGFSRDGRFFMFGQHVLIPESGQAYAELGVVDVPRNSFVADGWKKRSWNLRILPNLDSRGALYELLAETVGLKQRYNISSLDQGRLLYTRGIDDESSNGEEPTLHFRDFDRGREFTLALPQMSETSDEVVSASFHVELTIVDSSGARASYTAGRPNLMRKDVAAYRAARVWVGPDGRSVVIAVAKESPDLSIRYMVETLVID